MIISGGRRVALCCALLTFIFASASRVYAGHDYSDGPSVEKLLPASVAKTLDVNAWAWLEYLRTMGNEESTYWVGDFSLGATQHFGNRFAVSANVHFIDEDQHTWGFLEEAYGWGRVSTSLGTMVTVGKFNAAFGVEPRDEWDRVTGTTSLLFGAEPQDLIGVRITQPIGESGFKIKPFVANEFDGRGNFSQTPSGGVMLQYQHNDKFSVSVTNWVGPGLNFRAQPGSGLVIPPGPVPYVQRRPADSLFGPAPDATPSNATTGYVATDWRGPLFNGTVRSGTLYFLDAAATWTPAPKWTVASEGLLAINSPARGRFGWAGLLALVNYDITDKWHVFGRWSFLNDAETIVTGLHERRHELSTGMGYQIYHGVELRGEYRHDFAPSGDLDSLSAHLNVSF